MKKLLVCMMVLGLTCLAIPALAQVDADNGGVNQDATDDAIAVTNPNLAGATQGSGDQNANMDGDNLVGGTQIFVPDPNLQLGNANAADGGAASADATAAGEDSTAQEGLVNVSIPEANLFGAEAEGTENVAQDGTTNVYVPDASVLVGKANADDSSVATADTTASGERSTAQDGVINVSIPEANLLGARADNESVATWALQIGDNVETGNIAKDINNSAVAQGSTAADNVEGAAISDGGPAVMDEGAVATADVLPDTNVAIPIIGPAAVNGLQSVALNDLTQVNAGVYVGDDSGNSSGYLAMDSENSNQNGVMANSAGFGGVGRNVATQNVVNVSANANQVGTGSVSP